MIEFLKSNAPIIIMFATYGFFLFMALFKPQVIKKMRYNIVGSVGPIGGRMRTSTQVSRFGFLCVGSPFLTCGIGSVLYKYKLIGHDRFFHVFVAGFVLVGIGVIYDMCRKNK